MLPLKGAGGTAFVKAVVQPPDAPHGLTLKLSAATFPPFTPTSARLPAATRAPACRDTVLTSTSTWTGRFAPSRAWPSRAMLPACWRRRSLPGEGDPAGHPTGRAGQLRPQRARPRLARLHVGRAEVPQAGINRLQGHLLATLHAARTYSRPGPGIRSAGRFALDNRQAGLAQAQTHQGPWKNICCIHKKGLDRETICGIIMDASISALARCGSGGANRHEPADRL